MFVLPPVEGVPDAAAMASVPLTGFVGAGVTPLGPVAQRMACPPLVGAGAGRVPGSPLRHQIRGERADPGEAFRDATCASDPTVNRGPSSLYLSAV